MPDINIHEVDRTGGQTDYGSEVLSIALAGLVNLDTIYNDEYEPVESGGTKTRWDKAVHDKKVDENDVIKLNSKADFSSYIGQVENSQSSTEAVYTTLKKNPDRTTSEDPIDIYLFPTNGIGTAHTGISGEDFYSTYKGRVYEYIAEASGDNQNPTTTEPSAPWAADTVWAKLSDKYYKLTKATDLYNGNGTQKNYVIVTNDPHAAGTLTSNVSLGNQIASMLLDIGYTIYYKKIDSDMDLWATGEEAGDSIWAIFKDKSAYDFRFITTGLYKTIENITATHLNTAYNNIALVAKNRGDCTALVDLNDAIYDGTYKTKYPSARLTTIANAITDNMGKENQYVALFTSGIELLSAPTGYTNTNLPGSFRYLDCFANMINNGYAEWYAVANTTRGGVGYYPLVQVTAPIGSMMLTPLEPRTDTNELSIPCAINPIMTTKTGFVIMGNRTAKTLDQKGLTATHFLNIRQLVTSISKQTYNVCRAYQFDPNSDTLWVNFKAGITPLLDRMVAGEGIRNYEIVKVKAKQKAELRARIRIVPIEAVEDFDIEINLENDLATINVAE